MLGKKGWTTLDASIDGGIDFLANEYIRKGQNTLYLQKFDVDNTDGSLYWHQYMQNLMAAQSEGSTLRNTYQNINAFNTKHTFVIPLYENMPVQACNRPNTSTDINETTDIVKVNVEESLRLRNEPNGSTTIGWLLRDEYVTRIEKATTKVNGTYWDKVMKSNGTTGYAARETYETEANYKLYLVPVNNQENNNNDNSSNNDDNQNNNIKDTEKVKIDKANKIITVKPDVIAQDILDAFGGPTKIVKSDESFLENEESVIGTGYKVKDEYIVVKKGDVNGDGIVDTGDTYMAKLVVLEMKTLENDASKKATDVNNDGIIDTGDTFLLKKQVMGIENISI